MAENYEEIVRKWYVKMRGSFTDLLMDRYGRTNMRLADAENIYQDIFLAIHKNLQEGRIGENCNWRSYIIRVGLNMASKKYRSDRRVVSIDEINAQETDRLSARVARIQKIAELLRSLPAPEEETDLYENVEARALVGDELNHTPEPCASIISMTYCDDMRDAEIAAELPPYCDNGKPASDNAKAIKARRWLCMQDLIYRVRLSLYNAGFIDEKPEKKKRNGK